MKVEIVDGESREIIENIPEGTLALDSTRVVYLVTDIWANAEFRASRTISLNDRPFRVLIELETGLSQLFHYSVKMTVVQPLNIVKVG